MEIIAMILGLIGLVCAIGTLVCWVMVIMAAFKNEESPLMGILSIVLCSLGALIIGWIHNKQWGISKLMMVFTGLVVANIIIQVVTVVLMAAAGAAQNGQL